VGDEFELAELPSGVSVVSVVWPGEDAGAEPSHVFQVRRDGKVLAEVTSLRDVAQVLRGMDDLPEG
jgi:hypothetical protein